MRKRSVSTFFPGLACVFILLITLVGCSPSPSMYVFSIKKLKHDQHIEIGDKSLKDWNERYLIWEQNKTSKNQWKKIRNEKPKSPVEQDQNLRVLMTHNDRYWLIAVEVSDDHIVTATDPKRQPFGGDCFEIFFAGSRLGSRADIHHLINDTGSELSPAKFFQMMITPSAENDIGSVLSDYRTDTVLIDRLLKPGSGFEVSTWNISQNRWAAELRIPFEVFSSEVKQTIRDRRKMRIGFDYTDYDGVPARDRDIPPEYGFSPDNVFSHNVHEKNVNTPKFMPSIIFVGE